ncbi:hypothetical protein GH714_008661 [Hevea brasiliensis]|uniref:aspartate transaminase n=1 Tax=Hevea brasiliensis TaxID=3981 RepID=A0A6A6MLX2_HEVBR|nr:hypothetical protein GH714_008661 [Hevea brasiliensis]
METGIIIVAACLLLSLAMGIMFQSPPLLAALLISFALGSVYSIELPFLRWKKHAFLAASCILIARAMVVQLAFFVHIQKFVLGKPIVICRSLVFATAFMCFFSAVIALFKDIPDVDGDRDFGIQSFSLSLGQEKGKVRLGSGNLTAWFHKEKSNPFINTKSSGRISMAVAVNVSRFEGITMAPPDPILGVSEAFKADNDEKKLNLGVGAYRTEELQPYVLNVVKKAENLMLERGEYKEYLPIEGLAAFNKVTAELLLGADNTVIKQQRLRLIERYFPGAKVLISSPTWGNHKNIFNDARVPWSEYRYYDPKTVGLDFEGMIADLKAAPEGSFILLHGCAHNPTGIDPTPEQWEKIADVIQEKNHIPFFDVAYQGFASGSLDAMQHQVKSQLKRLARPMYSNPPVHGARIVANVVGDPTLFDEWKAEMDMMAGRIKGVRQKLFDSLSAKDKSGKDWSFILKQIGMFSFTGLNKAQSENMTNKWHVYMTKDGRISLAGLNLAKCEYLADAIVDSYHNAKGLNSV